jgi:YopX protein.
MRTIKFRAWDTKDMVMVIWIDEEGRGLYGSPLWEDYSVSGNDRFIPMQFTGLHDKNGREIYEGDIIEFRRWERSAEDREKKSPLFYSRREAVEFDKGTFYCGAPLCNWLHSEDYLIKEMEVIGNVHENPELLK